VTLMTFDNSRTVVESKSIQSLVLIIDYKLLNVLINNTENIEQRNIGGLFIV